MSAASTMLGNFTNGGQIVEFAIQGALGIAVAYNTVGSPHATLRDCWETLCDIKTRLKAVTNERRQKIAAAAATRKCRSLADIESEFQKYVVHGSDSPSPQLTPYQVCGMRTRN